MHVQRIREDFPALRRERQGKKPIYFDNACMAMKPRQVIDAISRYYEDSPACTGHGRSAHWFAHEVGQECEEARESIRRFINAETCDEIIFTRNTTESINLVARTFRFQPGDVILTTDREHNSNLCPWKNLESRGIIQHGIVRSNQDEMFSLGNLETRLEEGGVGLASFVHASNLDGYTIPAKDVIRMCHDYNVPVMLDAAQSAPHKPLDVQDLDVDFLAFSVHKMGGPTGMGVLYGKAELLEDLDYFIVGGDTVKDTYYEKDPIYLKAPAKFEAGLQNYAGIAGAGAAAEYLMSVGLDTVAQHEYELNRYLTEHLMRSEEIEILGPRDPELRGGIVTFVVKRRGLGDIGEKFNSYNNIMIRTGSFCVHSWFNARRINKEAVPIRASLYIYNSLEECEVFVETLERIVQEVKDYPRLQVHVDE